MLEYPELYTITRQMEKELSGRTVAGAVLVNKNSNLFMDTDAPEKYPLLLGGRVIGAELCAPEIYIRLDNGYGIHFRQCGGKILFHRTPPASPKCTFLFSFTDGSALTYTMMLWSMGIYAVTHQEWENKKKDILSHFFNPLVCDSFEEYLAFFEKDAEKLSMPIKIFLSKNIAGIMSSYAAEILIYAGVYPSKRLDKLTVDEHKRVWDSMKRVLEKACEAGGKNTELDLYGKKGGYIVMAERKHIGEGCPVCGGELGKNSTGGVSAFCPACQKK
ncbi:MAG: DNA-formamidopyrimidine glycosylase family protein [Eubacteriales bacterium]